MCFIGRRHTSPRFLTPDAFLRTLTRDTLPFQRRPDNSLEGVQGMAAVGSHQAPLRRHRQHSHNMRCPTHRLTKTAKLFRLSSTHCWLARKHSNKSYSVKQMHAKYGHHTRPRLLCLGTPPLTAAIAPPGRPRRVSHITTDFDCRGRHFAPCDNTHKTCRQRPQVRPAVVLAPHVLVLAVLLWPICEISRRLAFIPH